jgi:RimJ/RimL family protein N-acetyltransferase
MYKYNNIAFRVIEENDLGILKDLHNSQSTWENLFNIDFVDDQSQLAWWRSLYKKQTDKRYVIILADNPEVIIGRLRIQNINMQHNNCEIGIDIIEEYRGKGYGFQSYNMLLEYLFKHFNMNMVYLKVAEFNMNASKLYEKIGFIKTGYYPSFFFRNGKYWNYNIYCIESKDYLSKK